MTSLGELFARASQEYSKKPESERDICAGCGKSYLGMGGYRITYRGNKKFYCFDCSKTMPEEDRKNLEEGLHDYMTDHDAYIKKRLEQSK